ncbi:MAG: hypothetical protein LBQ93_12025 [Treponema sp.]|jgi:tetratricopeptide (TPR) repeat protein|nr:hypothetical protein [Treponema sp.]
MKFRPVILVVLFCWAFCFSFAQSYDDAFVWGDAEAAGQYAIWAQQAINEGRMREALASLERAADFANVSSDISYLLALARSAEGKKRTSVVQALDTALDVNRWVDYNKDHALLLKAEQLIAMRRFESALNVLDQIGQTRQGGVPDASDFLMARLLAFRGLALGFGSVTQLDADQALARFRSLMLTAMDRFPRDPRPLRIFFEYARNRNPEPSELVQSDLNLFELALRRLPFLLEADPELAWIAYPFIQNTEDARRLVASYRSGGLYSIQNRDFMPSPGSISAALNLGLISDSEAVEELFSGSRGFNSPLPSGIAANGNPVLDKAVITEVFNLLRSEQGRDLFTQKLLSFSGIITSDDDNDGYIDNYSYYRSGVIREFEYDKYQDKVFDLRVTFSAEGVPVSAEIPLTGRFSPVRVKWERYPSVEQAMLAGETFSFRPADFQFLPVSFIVLGGGANRLGIAYPVMSNQSELTRRTLVSFCASISRSSVEFDNAVETIFFEQGLPRQAVEILDGINVSVTAFERGIPVIQYLDLDFDGRMETIRSFHRPGLEYPWPDSDQSFDYRKLIASSESDWTGEGAYKTGEMYLQDGSVVYSWDIDGSGIMNYSETENGNQ